MPDEMAPSQALAKRLNETGLMLPPPPPKRIKRPAQVLDEDVYAAGLSHIIARDFFPGLLEAKAQDEYLTAVESKDKDWIMEAGRKMQQAMTPGPDRYRSTSFRTPAPDATPRKEDGATFAATPTPAREIEDEEPVRPQVDVNMSLGAFQAKYTSEDNESFNELLDKQNTRRTTKYAHFFHGNKIPSARQIEYRNERKAIMDSQHNDDQALIITNSKGEERQLITAGRPSQDLDERPASLQSFPDRQGPRNGFMFEPDSVEDQVVTAAAEADARSKAPPRAVTYTATRFNDDVDRPESKVPPSPSMSAIDAAIAGRPRHSTSSVGYNGAETPRVNGYAFVDAEPTPSGLGVPIANEEAEAAEREQFEKLLPKAEDTGSNPFTIAQQSKREDIHHRLVEKSDAGRRKGNRMEDLRRLGITPIASPRFSTAPKKTAGQMTPAARQLAARLSTPRAGQW